MDLAGLIQSLGFPFAMCCMLFYLVETELKAMRISLDNNTKVITRLYEKMGGDVGDGN